MKEQQAGDCPCFKKVGPFYGSSKNIDIIRYADVLLMKAEALIELNRQAEALPLINEVRARANNSKERTRKADGTYPSNFLISEYHLANITGIRLLQGQPCSGKAGLSLPWRAHGYLTLFVGVLLRKRLMPISPKRKHGGHSSALRYSQKAAMNITLFLKGKLTIPKVCISKTQDTKF